MVHAPQAIHVWAPGIAETGGIQHYSHCLVQALVTLYPGARIRVLSKNDRPGAARCPGATRIHGFGHLPPQLRTWAYVLVGYFWLWRERPLFGVMTHPHFAKALSVIPTRTPMIAVTHGIEIWGHLQGRLLRGLQACAGLLPVSEFTRQTMLREASLSEDKVQVVPDTFREHAFTLGPKPMLLLQRHVLAATQPVLLTVGRLSASEAYKGHDQVIEALVTIRQSHPETRYVIVGTGDDEARLRDCAERHGQSEAVIFAGFIPDQELPDYYRLCDAFVMPSTGEGFGIVYLEALASGKPCVVGNKDASPEAIGHGRLGFAVNPRSPDEIAKAVVKLLSGDHDKPWLKEPETLRREVIDLYGFAAFQRHLDNALCKVLPVFHPVPNRQPPESS
ncbi:MAG: glycosyltransferase family 4 protein [Verrucomicrobiaceae bacterium]